MLSVPLAARARGCAAATATVPLLSGSAMVLFCVGPVTRLQIHEDGLLESASQVGLLNAHAMQALGGQSRSTCSQQASLSMSHRLTCWWIVQCWRRLQVEKESSFG